MPKSCSKSCKHIFLLSLRLEHEIFSSLISYGHDNRQLTAEIDDQTRLPLTMYADALHSRSFGRKALQQFPVDCYAPQPAVNPQLPEAIIGRDSERVGLVGHRSSHLRRLMEKAVSACRGRPTRPQRMYIAVFVVVSDDRCDTESLNDTAVPANSSRWTLLPPCCPDLHIGQRKRIQWMSISNSQPYYNSSFSSIVCQINKPLTGSPKRL